MKIALFGLAVIAFFAVMIYIQIGVWQECRADHSFFYCMNLMNHK